MMQREEISFTLLHIVGERIIKKNLTKSLLECELRTDLGLSTLNLVALSQEVEKHFHVSVAASVWTGYHTKVRDLINEIHKLINNSVPDQKVYDNYFAGADPASQRKKILERDEAGHVESSSPETVEGNLYFPAPTSTDKNIRMEKWESTDNQQEIHFFRENVYLLGYNPKYVDANTISKILDTL